MIAQISKNNLKLKPLEISTHAIVDIQHHFEELDFIPVISSLFQTFNKSILTGARYCSIQGSTAAQLRYKQDNSLITLYQVNYHDTFTELAPFKDSNKPIVTFARGLKITMWKEKGLVMVSAE